MAKPVEKISGKKLSAVRRALLQTQQEWAVALGWSVGNLRRVEGLDEAGVDLTSFRDLAVHLKMKPEELRKKIGVETEDPSLRNTGSVQKLYEVPFYELAMPASHWAELVDAEEVTNETGNIQAIDQGLFRVRIHGDCMEPKWHDGEIVEFRIWRHDSSFPVGRDVAVTDSNHMTTFKHLVGMADGGDTIVLRAHNQQKYPGDIRLPKTMMVRMAVAIGAFDPRE